jgi:hypothetical protein
MLLAAFCAASFLYFARAWREPSRGNIVGWAVFSALGLLTHSFAAFLVAPEALWLLYVCRSRAMLTAVCAVAAVQVALLPIVFTHATHTLLGFIDSTSLGIRLESVPVAFALGSPYESTFAGYGLLGAAALAAPVIALLVIGADSVRLRGAGVAAALAGVVIVVPLFLALLGEDYYIPRALIPAWVPLAVVVGAACTAPRVRTAGGVLAVVLLAGCVYAQSVIERNSQYQRPNWRGVAAALGRAAPGGRMIAAYDGEFATDPLAVYLPGIAWSQSGNAPVRVGEIDVVGHAWQAVMRPLPSGMRLTGTKTVGDFLVARFAVLPPRPVTRQQTEVIAPSLLGPAPPSGVVLVQSPS